ncbi:hypothetical protein BASA50_010964 [Batrachochytrium salamandrivorans]|uniref:Uncharacterized protein n=1 Tax=Batrachochytrium salamandrivorans TaxID=1357716 RepID=A0ABQ8EX08_9FUNG|nr:hypothetical protein BASA60_010370 [Batrachochytrium salamandrivorans]KAH6587945.1 hypothetical protein BASA50_010964 [Batrachochytrium salamandrivorans]KAH9270493.1 hypothetical protein BASA83_007305 [Batrachochytrium salamandrivorans]
MRLISFAVISLLAITVSAHLPPSTSADKAAIEQKIQDLTAAHQVQCALVTKCREPNEVEEKEQAIRSVMEDIKEELKKKNLPEGEKPKLEKHYVESVDDLEKAKSARIPKQQQLDDAFDQRYDLWIKARMLKETLALKEEQDARDKSKTDASPSLSPYRDILQEQINEAFQSANDLYMAHKDISSGISKLDEVIDRAKDPKKNKLYEAWKKVMFTRQKLAKQVGLSKIQGHHAEELQTEFGWPTQNSLVTRLYQSLWLWR